MSKRTKSPVARAVLGAAGLLAALTVAVAAPAGAQTSDLVITGVVDGPLAGGLPKAVELYATADIADLSAYGIGSANNGGGTDGEELTLSGSASEGQHLYVASESAGFATFFGFAPDFTSAAANVNGDDAIELFMSGAVIDVFGDIDVDGTGEVWDHVDGWAYRVDGTGPDGSSFVPANWMFSGPDALDGETSNATAATPFPAGTYEADPSGGAAALLLTQYVEGTGSNKALEITNIGTASADLSTFELEVYSDGAATPTSTQALAGTLGAGEVYVVANSGASAAILAVTDLTSGTASWDGDDAIVLRDGADAVVDSLGRVGEDPGAAWEANGVSTVDATLCRLDTLTAGDTDPADPFDPSDEWSAIGLDAIDGLGEPGCEADPGGPVQALISEVQGTGPAVALPGPVEVQAVVIWLFERADVLDGFFVQEEDADADADPLTSEGIFVFCRGVCPAALAVGDLVTVTGDATDFFGMSQIDVTGGGSVTIDASGSPLPAPTSVPLPAPGPTDGTGETTFEQYEGMHVVFDDTLAVSEYFQLARYGEIVLTLDDRPFQFTHTDAPSVAGFEAFLDDLATRTIILDDLDNDQNEPLGPPDEPYFFPEGGLSTTNRFRGGDTITGMAGILHWSFAGQSGTDAWRVRPIPSEHDYTFTAANPAPAGPADVGGAVTVASFNVLNYFTTIDDGSPACGPTGGLDCRGADSVAELERQRDKIVAALAAIDADIVGLIEIENDADASVADLVDGLNAVAGAGTYSFVGTGTIGTDAIKVALIYKSATVTPAGSFAILDSSVDPAFIDTKNRPALIQTFDAVAGGGRFTVAVNHLKSKGSDCDDVGDPDLGDGQANCSQTRRDAAVALAGYLATDPTASGDPDALIIGDLNAYATEQAITDLEGLGYTDLIEASVGPDAYSFVFDGQIGYLDHALANASLVGQVTGVDAWHINADEVPLFDYNDAVQDPGEASFERESDALPLYDPDPLRSSDHDPVIVGLDLEDAGGDPVLACGDVSGTEVELTALGYDVFVGTDGDDVIDVDGGFRPDFVLGLGGSDEIRTGLRDDIVCAGDGDDTVITGIGDDMIDGGPGADLVDAGIGDDVLLGGDGDDVLLGGTGRDLVDGGDGDDIMFGGTGGDVLVGGEGADRLFGETAADELSGGPGADLCDGGTGRDSDDGTCESVTSIP